MKKQILAYSTQEKQNSDLSGFDAPEDTHVFSIPQLKEMLKLAKAVHKQHPDTVNRVIFDKHMFKARACGEAQYYQYQDSDFVAEHKGRFETLFQEVQNEK